MTNDDLKVALNKLVKDGQIWANCPRCSITLSHKEYTKKNCDTCGKFELDDVKFFPKTEQC